MARKIQKTLSLILALSMSMSLLSVTAFAEGSEEPTVTEPKSEFSAPAGENGSGAGTAESPSLTVKEDTKVDEGKLTTTTTTTTEKEWTGTTTPDKGDEVDDKTTTSTTVTGQETTEESKVTTNFTGTTLKESGSTEGSQTTTTTETTTNTETAKSDKVSTSSTEKGTESEPEVETDVEVDKSEEKTPETSDISDSSVDFTGTTITVTPNETKTENKTAPITDAQRKEALEKLAGGDPVEKDFTADSTTGTYTKTEEIKGTDGETVIGSMTTTIVPVYDDKDGKTIIGYTKTVSSSEKTSHNVSESKGKETEVAGSASTTDDKDESTTTTVTHKVLSGTLAKPDDVADVTNEDGSVTRTTIEPITAILNDGEAETIVGYKVTTVTELNGKTIATTSKSSYASITTTTTVTTPKRTDTKYEQVVTTVTTDVYKESTDITTAVVKPGSGTVTVTMDKVTNNSTINKLESLKPQDGLRPDNGEIDSDRDLYGRANDDTVTNKYQDGYDYQWEGTYGLESTIRIEAKKTDGSATRNTWQPHQFELIKKDSDDRFYTYCADYTTDAREGAIYNMINVEDATYFSDDSATGGLSSKQKAEMVRTIAMTGYWGTAAGEKDEKGNYAVGSLEQLKKTLREDSNCTLTDEQINALTDGQALTATQAAIWKFGNSGEHGINDSNVVGCTYIGGDSFDKTSDADKNVVNALYQYLTSLQAKEATHDTTILNENTVKGADVALKSKNDDGSYQANLSFTLAVTPSTMNDDLTISIYQDGEVIGIKKLDKDCTFASSKDGNVFTFENVRLSNGAKIELKLTGTHALDQGVYLYSAASYDKSQTFVGVATGSQDVKISTSLTINFADPDAELEMSGSTEEKTRTETSTTQRTDTITKSDFFNEIKTTETTITETQLEWASSWENIIDRNTGDDDDDDDDDDDNTNGDDDDDDDDDDDGGDIVIPDGHVPSTSIPEETIEIPDEIPTTNVPKTGDASVIWYILSACSGIGLAGTTLLGKKRRSDDLED